MASEERFEGIPENAVRKDEQFRVTSSNDLESPWVGQDIEMESDIPGTRVYVHDKFGRVEITTEYNAWLETLPVVNSVTFEWTEETK